MNRFVLKYVLFVTLLILLILLGYLITARKISFQDLPKNNISNSNCFRAKIDHVIRKDFLENSTFLISGSSMSLNNISGRVIQNRTIAQVYNVSSYGTKPKETIGFLNYDIPGNRLNYLLVAFNNCDFGDLNNINVDFPATSTFVNGNFIQRLWIFLKTFNINIFYSDWNYRTQYAHILNNYKSLKFDDFGSVELKREGFVIDKSRWEQYYDTTGFDIFYRDIIHLKTICERNEVTLLLVYLPFRSDLLTDRYIAENHEVARVMEEEMGPYFIDLSNLNVNPDYYCDYAHFFKDGAEYITNLIMDSLQFQTVQFRVGGNMGMNYLFAE